MSTDRLSKLFEANMHFTSQGTHGEKGTGLGLILCKEMAEANGGHIEVTSKEGLGSTFYVYLKATS
jgi:two-component system, sensor histidine kinase and response regulator